MGNGSIIAPKPSTTTAAVVAAHAPVLQRNAKIAEFKESKTFKDLAAALVRSGAFKTEAEATKRLTDILESMDSRLNDIDSTINLFKASTDIMAKMVGKVRDEKVANDIVDLEKQATALANKCRLSEFGTSKDIIRNWLVRVTVEQLNNGTIKPSDTIALVNQVTIGTDEFNIYLKDNNIGMITPEAYDVHFGDQNRKYEPKLDNKTLGQFTEMMEKDVLKFYSIMSRTVLTDMISAFASNKFILLKDKELSTYVQKAILTIAMTNIAKSIPDDPKDKKVSDAARKKLEDLAGEYLKAGKLEQLLGGKPSEQDAARGVKPFNFLVGYEESILVGMLKLAQAKGLEGDRMYSVAGFGTLWNTSNSVRTQVVAQGGSENDFYKLDTKDEQVRTALYDYICSWGLNGQGFKFDPSKVKERDVIDLMADTGKVKGLVTRAAEDEAKAKAAGKTTVPAAGGTVNVVSAGSAKKPPAPPLK